MIFQGGYYTDVLNEYLATKDSPYLQDVQNYEKQITKTCLQMQEGGRYLWNIREYLVLNLAQIQIDHF